MANVDWQSLKEHHHAGSLKEHFKATFINDSANEAYIRYCEYIIAEYKEQSLHLPEVSIAVSLLRVLLLSLPSSVISGLSINVSLIDWIRSVITNREHKPAVKGAAISILSILVKSAPRASDCFDSITDCFTLALKNCWEELCSDNQDKYLGLVIVLHQLEELLNCTGNSASWHLGDSLNYLACIVQRLSSLETVKVDNISRLQVDSAKLCAMTSEIWAAESRTATAGGVQLVVDPVVLSLAQSLFTIVTAGAVTHDCFHSAFHGAVDVLRILKQSSALSDQAAAVWGAVQEQCVEYVLSGGDLRNTVDCARMESVVGFLSCFHASTNPADDSKRKLLAEFTQAEQDAVSATVHCMVALQGRMRSALVRPLSEDDEPLSAEERVEADRELKSQYSDLRKSCIASLSVVLGDSPPWIAAHQTEFWDLCLKSLTTPVLFTAGYNALSTDELFVTRILSYFQASLRSIARYSSSAADDIVQALQDLVDSCASIPCPQLFCSTSSACNIPKALLSAFYSSPKSSSGARNAAEGQLNWRISVVATANSLMQQCIKQFSEYQTSAVLSWLRDCVELLGAEIEILSPTKPAELGGKTKKSSANADLKAELLQSLTIAAITAVDLLHKLDTTAATVAGVAVQSAEDGGSDSDRSAILSALLKLAVHLMQGLSRPIVFEDDRVQVCTETDLLGRIAIAMTSAGDASANHATATVIALGNMLCARNNCDSSLLVDLSSYFQLSHSPVGSEEQFSVALQQVWEEMRCLHGSSLSSAESAPLSLDCDMIYESGREAVLSIAHHCSAMAADKQPQCAAVDKSLQSIYDSLPLEVTPQNETSLSGTRKLKVKSSFVYEILLNIKVLCQ